MKTNLFKTEKTSLVFLLLFWAMPYVLLADGNPPVGAINGLFSVSATEQVYFSQGNLQYIGTASTPYWRFAENQWDYFGTNTGQNNNSQNVDRDLFGWATSGFNHGANCYQPWSMSETNSDYYAYGQYNYNLYDQSGMADWGRNSIMNGGNQSNQWRTLTKDEWDYIINYRKTSSGVRWVQAKVNNVNGIILLPDNWSNTYYSFNYPNVNSTEWGYNPISATTWSMLEQHGAVFLPTSGGRWSGGEISHGTSLYWSATYCDADQAYVLSFGNSTMYPSYKRNRFLGGAVRLVRNADSYFYGVNTTANPAEGGTVVGAGDYEIGSTCTLIAAANEGYQFVNWTKDGTIVSTNENYSFVVTCHQTLVANFEVVPSSWPEGTLSGVFSVSDTQQVQFSQGNLQYQASTNIWKFAEHQYDYIGSANSNISQTYTGWIDLFGWATSGYNHGSVYYHPWDYTKNSPGYSAYGNTSYPQYNLFDQTGQADWGYNAISNGGDVENLWRTMTGNEWDYVLNTRPTVSGIRFVKALVNNVNGLILLPDDWNANTYSLNNPNVGNANFSTNTLSSSEWNDLEQAGAVFLPAAGYREGTLVKTVNGQGCYWSSSTYGSSHAYYIYFNSSGMSVYNNNYDDGQSVRLVRPVMNTFFGINVSLNPVSGGTITGSGEYEEGSTCTLTATPNEGYVFVNWTENNVVVSTEATYSFLVTGDRNLVANFVASKNISITGYGNSTGGYYFIAPPFNNIDPDEITGMTEGDFDLFYFDQGQELEWRNYKKGAFNLASGKGYLYAHGTDVTLNFTGVPYNDNGQVHLDYVNGAEFAGWNLVGNPFLQTAYLIDSRPFFVMNTEGTEIIAAGNSAISPMQGIFVVTDNVSGEDITFTTSAPSNSKGQIMLNLKKDMPDEIDRAVVRFDGRSTLPKFMLDDDNTKVYIPQGDKQFAVVNSSSENVIPVNFKSKEDGVFALEVNIDNLEMDYLHLIDNITGIDVDLLATPKYTFEAHKTDYASRFKLVLDASNSVDNTFAYISNGNVVVTNKGESVLRVIDVLGRLISTQIIHDNANISVMNIPGVYVLQLVNGTNVKTQKIVVE